MAGLAGYAVTIVDPRQAFATAARFPGVALDGGWPDEALRRLAPDARTAVVALTHDPKLDDPALSVALRSPAFYVGALGSRRTQARRREQLREAGVTDEELARLRAPIGLDLGGREPEEIALAILAEVQAVRHGRCGEALRDARGPIHAGG
jgi:xanthine dehydrogenase accessory factor